MAETVMEQISYELSLDPLDVRMTNMDVLKLPEYSEMVHKIKTKADYDARRAAVDKFNIDNRWIKRGLRWAFMEWKPLTPTYYGMILQVLHGDASVVMTHGGVEMGQGINTKVVQVCAYYLKIPMEKIQVKACDTTTSPNALITGSSVTSQNICRVAEQCCQQLLLRLAPIRILLVNPTWEDLIKKAFALNVDIQVHGFLGEVLTPPIATKGVALCEAEIDVITGESQIIRVDLTEDAGRAISPMIDIGQVEGAFIMGMGYYTCEHLVYAESGELLTNRAWNYHVPQARDIPQDLRIYFKENPVSPDIVMGAKVIGEPPMIFSVSVPFALREAISAARLESNIPTTNYFQLDGPFTRESICLATATKEEDFSFT